MPTPLNVEAARQLCLAIPEIEETMPFGEDYLVYKLYGKMVALVSLVPNADGSNCMNVKCDPERAIALREHYEGITPGYHMNKRHWNSLWFEQDVTIDLARELVRHSADCVVAKLPLRQRAHYAVQMMATLGHRPAWWPQA